MNRIQYILSKTLSHSGVKGMEWHIRRYQDYGHGGYISKSGGIFIGDKTYGSVEKNKRPLNRYWRGDGPKVPSANASAHTYDWFPVGGGENAHARLESRYFNDPYEEYVTYNVKPMDREEASHMDLYDFLSNTNPESGMPGTIQNCSKCTAALALKKMGYTDVSAGWSEDGSSSNSMAYWFKKGNVYNGFNVNNVERNIKKLAYNTPGSFGEVAISYPNGGGHSMLWEIDDSGDVFVQDGQKCKIFDSIKDAIRVYGGSEENISISRLDDLEPNWEHIKNDGVVRFQGSHPKNRWDGREVDHW